MSSLFHLAILHPYRNPLPPADFPSNTIPPPFPTSPPNGAAHPSNSWVKLFPTHKLGQLKSLGAAANGDCELCKICCFLSPLALDNPNRVSGGGSAELSRAIPRQTLRCECVRLVYKQILSRAGENPKNSQKLTFSISIYFNVIFLAFFQVKRPKTDHTDTHERNR